MRSIFAVMTFGTLTPTSDAHTHMIRICIIRIPGGRRRQGGRARSRSDPGTPHSNTKGGGRGTGVSRRSLTMVFDLVVNSNRKRGRAVELPI